MPRKCFIECLNTHLTAIYSCLILSASSMINAISDGLQESLAWSGISSRCDSLWPVNTSNIGNCLMNLSWCGEGQLLRGLRTYLRPISGWASLHTNVGMNSLSMPLPDWPAGPLMLILMPCCIRLSVFWVCSQAAPSHLWTHPVPSGSPHRPFFTPVSACTSDTSSLQ